MKPLERKTKDPAYVVRRFRPGDRAALRRLCCETGLLGDPIDTVFSDHELFADYLTSYYTDWEPESTWVGIADGRLVGYLTACTRWNLHRIWTVWIALRLAVAGFLRWISGGYDAKDRKYLAWVILRARHETPSAPKHAAHFHFNAAKEHRRMHMMRDLMVTMLEELKAAGVPKVYGQMATYEGKRTDRLFEYFGWKVTDKIKLTKYKGIVDRDIYMTTIEKDFRAEETVKSPADSIARPRQQMPV